MPKDLFKDHFSSIQSDSVRESTKTNHEAYTETMWTDKRTGAQYKVKEKKPNGPQGDFRVSQEQADQRYRSIMGLSNRPSFHQSPQDDPFAEDRLKPEPIVSQQEIEEKIRTRAIFDTQREQNLRPTSEPAESHSGQWEDHGEFTVDPNGRIRDKPSSATQGPFGTEKERFLGPPSKLTKEHVIEVSGHEFRTQTKNALVDRSLEERIGEKRGLQELLTNVFRSMVAATTATSKERSLNDRPYSQDAMIDVPSILQSGILKPWSGKSDQALRPDRPDRPDQTAHQVGSRVLMALLKGPLAPDIQDLPKAERDDLTVAVGRAILNCMTVMPEKQGSKSAFIDTFQEKGRKELQKALSGALGPSLLKGLVKPEMIADVLIKDKVSIERVAGPSQLKAYEASERLPSTSFERRPEVEVNQRSNTFQGFTTRSQKKQMFDMSQPKQELHVNEPERALQIQDMSANVNRTQQSLIRKEFHNEQEIFYGGNFQNS